MKLLRAIAVACATACLTLCLAGCAGESPSKVVSNALDLMKKADYVTLQQQYGVSLFGSENGGETPSVLLEDFDGMTLAEKAFKDELIAKISDFDYNIASESIEGDKATVTVVLKTHDLSEVVSDTLGGYMQWAFSIALQRGLSGGVIGELEAANKLNELFAQNIAASTDKTVNSNLTVNLSKVDDKWKIQPLSDEAHNALVGGMLNQLKVLAAVLSQQQ